MFCIIQGIYTSWKTGPVAGEGRGALIPILWGYTYGHVGDPKAKWTGYYQMPGLELR